MHKTPHTVYVLLQLCPEACWWTSSTWGKSWGPKNHKTHTCCWKDATGTDGGTERPGNTGDCRRRATTSGEVSGCSSRRCTPLTVARYPRGETEREKPLWRRKAVMCLYTTIYVGKAATEDSLTVIEGIHFQHPKTEVRMPKCNSLSHLTMTGACRKQRQRS